jgi:hypothetical protein
MDFGVTVTATFDGDIPFFSCVWDPPPPYPRKLARKILRKYRTWRDSIFLEYAERTGKKIIVAEL